MGLSSRQKVELEVARDQDAEMFSGSRMESGSEMRR